MSSEFEPDSDAISAARDITSALRDLSEEPLEPEQYHDSRGGAVVLERPGISKKPSKAQATFRELATKVARDVDMSDIAKDLATHEEMQRIATIGQISLPVLRIGKAINQREIPCLFSRDTLRALVRKDQQGYLDDLERKVMRLAERSFGSSQIEMVSQERVHTLFFDGLESFMAVRISGSRWLRAGNLPERDSSTGWFGGIARLLGTTKKEEGQWWDVINRKSGLVLYWINEYGAREEKTNIGGKTKPPDPFKVFLLPGNGHIGADALPNHEPHFDESVVRVPSRNPIFATNQF